MASQLRWGLIGASLITRDFVLAIRRAGLTRHRLVAIASRSTKAEAEKMAAEFGIERVYTDYDEMMACSDIDAIYIGLVHQQHYPVALAAIKAGKAVLVEKPMTTTVEDAVALVEASKKHNVLLTEAVWSAFCPVYLRIRELLTTVHAVGLQIAFTVAFPDRPSRPDSPEIGYNSAMWGIGIYAIHMATVVFGPSPVSVVAAGRLDSNNVDRAEAISITYKPAEDKQETRVASLYIDTQSGAPTDCVAVIFCRPDNSANISTIRVAPSFWMPNRLEIVKTNGEVVVEDYPLPSVVDQKYKDTKFTFINSEGLAYEADAFADAFDLWKNTGSLEHQLRRHEDSVSDAKIMATSLEMIRKQHNV